jgi:hypothetical protein
MWLVVLPVLVHGWNFMPPKLGSARGFCIGSEVD